MALDKKEAALVEALASKMNVFKEAERLKGVEMFMGIPDHWYDVPHWRCTGEHVSRSYLKSEGLGRNACLECGGHVFLTFPEDKDGPLL